MKIRLTPEEMQRCWAVANERHQSARANGAVCTLELTAKNNPLDQDYIGIAGEVAYCKAFGLDTSLVLEDNRETLEELQQGDIKHNGVWVDLKASRHARARLIYPVMKKHRCKAQYLCLTTIDKDVVTIHGFARKEDFMRDENIGTLAGSRPLFILDQDQLEKAPTFTLEEKVFEEENGFSASLNFDFRKLGY